MTSATSAFLLVYFTPDPRDGEQVRFAVSTGARPEEFEVLNGGAPVVRSTVGEGGVRDPFIVRNPDTGGFVIVATDLRVQDGDEWHRTTRWGSRSVVVWESVDLTTWSDARLVEVAPPQAGNAWAPKAFWSGGSDGWLLFWASAWYDSGVSREAGAHQRIMVAPTRDFRTVGPASVYLDPGHDVIDATFVEYRGEVLRFSANAQSGEADKTVGFHIFFERGHSLLDPAFRPVTVDVGRPELERAEGPAVAVAHDGSEVYLLIDEFTGRGYTLFSSSDPVADGFTWEPGARLPPHSRHGSLLAITGPERERLIAAFG